MKALYINPYTDFGFKKLFGTPASKELLIDFLNQVLPPKHRITDLVFKNTELLGAANFERKAIFDIYCETTNGERIIVEMQKAKINFFKDRSIFYSTFPIREQAEKGDWDFQLNPVYCVALLDFTFDDSRKHQHYISNVKLMNQYCEVFFDKLHFIFIEMPRFNKKEDELSNHFEKWLYFLKNLESFDHIPIILNEPIFEKGFELAKLAQLNPNELQEYEQSIKTYRDWYAVVKTSFDEGKIEGKIEVAKNLKATGMNHEMISKLTGLTLLEIDKL
jgi:predicted transposase/invertase (TIGR01784 family)